LHAAAAACSQASNQHAGSQSETGRREKTRAKPNRTCQMTKRNASRQYPSPLAAPSARPPVSRSGKKPSWQPTKKLSPRGTQRRPGGRNAYRSARTQSGPQHPPSRGPPPRQHAHAPRPAGARPPAVPPSPSISGPTMPAAESAVISSAAAASAARVALDSSMGPWRVGVRGRGVFA
jgi:hypothetical protein